MKAKDCSNFLPQFSFGVWFNRTRKSGASVLSAFY
jgi:hypothetical protein